MTGVIVSFVFGGQKRDMIALEPNRRAQLVASLHAPWRATVAECLDRWTSLDGGTRAHSYIVVDGIEPGTRHTLNSSRIAELAFALRSAAG